MTLSEISQAVEAKFGEASLKKTEFRGELTYTSPVARLKEILSYCKESLAFDYLVDISSVDNFGNEPRFISNLRSPGFQNWDMSAQKYWHLSEAVRLQGRAEFFNTFNHPNFYAPDTSLGDRVLNKDSQTTHITDGSFGTIRSSFSPRDIQFALKLYW